VIVFDVVRFKNFLSSGNVFTEIDLNRNPSTLIIGENGAGKSTFLDAITFALFGKPFRNINKPQLVNSINEKECLVEIEFSIASKQYKIRRGIKPGIFEIFCDKELLNQDAKSKDYQDQLEKFILKMNYKSFTQIVILGSTNFTPFMQLSASDRRAVIEDLLDIQIFSAMNSVVKSKIVGFKSEAETLKIQIDSTREKIELHKRHLDELKKNNAELIDAKKKEIEENATQLDFIDSSRIAYMDKIEQLNATVLDESSASSKFNKLTALQAKIENNKAKIQKDKTFYSTNSTCPTCDQDINNKDEKLASCNHKIEELDAGLQKLEEESNAVLQRIHTIKAIQKQIRDVEQDLVRDNTSFVQTQRYLKKLESEVEALSTKPAMSDEFKSQSKKLLNDLQSYTEARKEAACNYQHYDIASQLLKDGGIKTRIIKQYIPVINKLVNKYLASMDFFVNFNIDEEFKESIKSRHRDNFSYENFSEGEKKRIDLALLFTWRAVAKLKNSVHTNLLIFDEVFDGSLDNNGTEEFLKLLNLVNENTNVFVISHKGDVLADKFKHTIKFEKKNNFSRMA
jgi:DNA repair exonuclease SbcCD ATPase subunit